MIEYKQQQITVKEPVKVICDKCKKEFDTENIKYQEFLHIDFVGGYDSAFGDGNHVECDICDNCLKEMIQDYCRINGDKDG